MRYYIADLHFYHRTLNDHMDCRGFASVEEMNETMIRKWNEKVKPRDEVGILGVFSIKTAYSSGVFFILLKKYVFSETVQQSNINHYNNQISKIGCSIADKAGFDENIHPLKTT